VALTLGFELEYHQLAGRESAERLTLDGKTGLALGAFLHECVCVITGS
jgi:hypothetical protein